MNVQIAGFRGLLGQAVWHAFEEAGHVPFPAFCDIANARASDVLCPVVVNCAGIVKQRDLPPSEFARVNAYGPHALANACDRASARLIHVSTDCVFGLLPGPNTETSIPCPEDVYGATKLAGEVIYKPHLTIRTSFVGPGRRGLWADIAAGRPQRASANMLWSGHTTQALAGLIVRIAETSITGLLHIPGVPIDRWSLVNLLVAHLGVDLVVMRDDSYHRDRRLESVRYDDLGLPRLPPFHQQLLELRDVPQEPITIEGR